MAGRGNALSKTFIWILLALLIVGLAGFGATNLGGNIRSVGAVGDKTISVELYSRTLQEDLRAISAQAGQNIPFSTAQALGVDRQALARVITTRALDHETAELGLSVGDAQLQQQILSMSAFQGINGQFDREAYRFTLENAGLSEAEFEETLREEAARTLVQGAILSGNTVPDTYANTLVAYIGERRNATVARLKAEDLATPVAEPTEAQLQTYYDENIDAYTLPETKQITYALLSPDMIADTVEVDEAMLQTAYDERESEFNKPERRLIERLVYGNDDSASAAKAQLEAGGTTFETLVEDRGLALADIDLGDLDQGALGAAGEAIFAAETGDVVGPLQSDLGPALFRINGILAAQETSFEDARAQLRDELAADRARRVVEAQINDIEDLLAGGATLEDLAKETDMELGNINWSSEAGDGIAAYEAFREDAQAITVDDFPKIEVLEDGGIFAMRLDEVLAPRPQTLAEIIERVSVGWRTQATLEALRAEAEALLSQITAESDFADVDLEADTLTEVTRTGFVADIPPAAILALFEAEKGASVVVDDVTDVLIVRLDDVLAADEDSDDIQALRTQLNNQAATAVAQDLFEAYATEIQQRAGIQLDQNALNAVHANFN
ncbi:MAG: SurA N-terminal domain-containing protein [Planktotalea sp.]|uniref:SurA N-terminal domain-containing protein n=1 Tax=Planktotalea sp. TaxID=2029877 RepID=UPI002632D22C|nr:SurA N-terminal domain-containing protein [Planktotalea sp.]MDG1085891.1 SurA N-terminal domain-containing protein [Planktotalea sp.]